MSYYNREDDLPTSFDIIVVGTGMPECMIAAAAARVGKKVLHVDRHGYYGGDWASFSYDKFQEWIAEVQAPYEPSETPIDLISYLASFIREEENLIVCPIRSRTITDLTYKSYVKDAPDPPTAEAAASETDKEISTPGNTPVIPLEETEGEPSEGISNSDNAEEPIAESEGNKDEPNAASETPPVLQVPLQQQEWTLSAFMENRRKFNIDLAPKIMFSRGSLVELLISSNIARYAEFQCITRVLTHINGHVEQVPCSRADVFSTKTVTVVEKRMLMKFLTFCMKFEEQSDEYKEFEEKPFVEFLRSRKLTSNVEHYIVHAIAMVDESCTTVEGLKATQKFLQSLGRYGKSPFLCTCYGSAELPQCFCRLCAVYEGMYYLKRKVDGIVTDKNNKCISLVSMGQRINCEFLIMESSYAPFEFFSPHIPLRIARAILITDASLCPSEKRENTLLKLPRGHGIEHPVTVIELSSKNYVCPEDLYLVYLSCRATGGCPEADLKPAVDLLFNKNEEACPDEKHPPRPNLLWIAYFDQRDTSVIDLNANVPDHLFLVSSPNLEVDYEHAVAEARTVFGKICPGEEFLPRAPDPEDILIETHNNPGDEGDEGKIENDVTNSEDEEGSGPGTPE